MEQELLRLLEDYNLLNNPSSGKVIIQSFSKDSLNRIHDENSEIPLIQLVNKKQAASMTNKELLNIAEYASGIGINYKDLTTELAQHIREAGLELHPYTVNAEDAILEMIEMGATGVFTDFIDLVPK